MGRSARGAGLLVGVLLVISATTASAATAPVGPRLAGVFKVKIDIRRSGPNSIYDPGDSVRRHWGFFPKCASGACFETVLKRQTAESHRFIVMVRHGRRAYTGSTTFVAPAQHGDCHYRYHDEIHLRVTGVAAIDGGPRVTRIRMRLVQRMTSSDCRLTPREQRLVADVRGQLRR